MENTQEPQKKTHTQKLQAKYDALVQRIANDTAQANAIAAELNAAAALAAVDVGATVKVKLGRKFADKDTTRTVTGVIIAVKVGDDGDKLYKVQHGTGFDAEIAIVSAASLAL